MTWTVTTTTGKHFSVVKSVLSSIGQDRFIIGMQSQLRRLRARYAGRPFAKRL